MKKEIVRWLVGFLRVVLIAGNLTYVSAGMPDVVGSWTGSVSDADMSVSGNDVSIPGEATFETEHDASVFENDTFETEHDTSILGNDEPVPETDISVSGNDVLVPESDAYSPAPLGGL